ncbi:cytochrome c oxidase assembly factor CtaG [Ectobacillus ponti]|uniref:Cytochrome c oxidase assembly factor CtaG n=1 Tax=Ectobacillus ponti TaxID=2961894 RepID=A0AA41XDU3_9BACI|nr:cytochrome c oxidase assembly factor CtaG [Ectobacillus ponti]MCP8970276.1 cytochrome c oxidase assembly factor CtaG [Ectobacillus ponti]
MSNLWIFGFEALWSPVFMLFMVGVLVAYFLIIGKYRSRFPNAEKVSGKQVFYFTAGIVLLYLAKGGPIDVLGHIIFSAHMVEMAVLYTVVPPLLLLGMPEWLLQHIISYRGVQLVLNTLGRPLIALFVFNGMFSIYHIPVVFDPMKQSQWGHPLFLFVMFISALLMWWPVLNPLPAYQSLTDIQKIGYMFANGMLLTPACALIIFASKPLFATYTDPQAWMQAMELCVPAGTLSSLGITGPDFLHWMPVVEDQQTGGVIMKIFQEIMYGTVIGYVFFRWVKKERQREQEMPQLPPYLLNSEKVK